LELGTCLDTWNLEVGICQAKPGTGGQAKTVGSNVIANFSSRIFRY